MFMDTLRNIRCTANRPDERGEEYWPRRRRYGDTSDTVRQCNRTANSGRTKESRVSIISTSCKRQMFRTNRNRKLKLIKFARTCIPRPLPKWTLQGYSSNAPTLPKYYFDEFQNIFWQSAPQQLPPFCSSKRRIP